MNTKLLLAAVVVVAVGAGAVVAIGDRFPGGSGADTDSLPTATPESGDEGGPTLEPTDSSTTATPTPPFGFVVDDIEECGRTCRDVTSTLTSRRDTTAENVTVYTRILVGRETDGDEVWRGTEDVGTLPAGESYTATTRVELSLADGLKIENSDGWITVQTTVETEDGAVTFADERQVA
jgi:hypothetical protein